MLTKLKAVNIILDSIGEDAVSQLNSGLSDAETAERVLDEVKDDVLELGWNFNTDYNFTITPDVDGFLVLSEDVLRLEPDGEFKRRLFAARVVDGETRLYDVENQTFVFSDPVTVTMVSNFEFEELPHAFRKYITLKAAGEYQQRIMGSQVLDSFLEKKIKDAWERLQDADADADADNILTDSPSVQAITYRYNQLRGR